MTLAAKFIVDYTSSDDFCAGCHAHPQATQSWKFSTHFDNQQGIVVHCVECHLPPDGPAHLSAKITTGFRDVYATLFTDIDRIDWEQRSTREAAARHVYKSACIRCHQNLFPRELSKKGEDAHLYYEQKRAELRCINCHLEVGHFHEKGPQDTIVDFDPSRIFSHAAVVDSFRDYREMIPGTQVSFDMIAIPSGEFIMGSPEDESFRQPDEDPQHRVRIGKFWMGKTEVSWDEYEAFYRETGRKQWTRVPPPEAQMLSVDAVTGPTPPYGNPDQGWGKGALPAITMTHYAARAYCRWLSGKTGRIYRLPTEAEWEYACRGGTTSAYFFQGEPGDYSRRTFLGGLIGPDTAVINTFVRYAENSGGRTHSPGSVSANPFGLLHMPGNVREFCTDIYRKDAYLREDAGPTGRFDIEAGSAEFVVRGGSFRSDAADVRSSARDHTDHNRWLLTDPQMPKSEWWYSDVTDVGFRVVCEYPVPD